jgi:hypothetical protein
MMAGGEVGVHLIHPRLRHQQRQREDALAGSGCIVAGAITSNVFTGLPSTRNSIFVVSVPGLLGVGLRAQNHFGVA